MTSEQRKAIRTLIRRYLERAEANQPDIHYSMNRLLTSLGDPPSTEFWTDCSGLAISAFRWADLWLPYKVEDPGGYAYSGAGNTQSILVTNRTRRIPENRMFFVGDMALFGSWSRTKHVTICRRNGTAFTSIWTSHGSERGPYAVRMKYRDDFLCVVRAKSLA